MLSVVEFKYLAAKERDLYDNPELGFIAIQPYMTSAEVPHIAGVHLTNNGFDRIAKNKDVAYCINERGIKYEKYFVEDGILFFTLIAVEKMDGNMVAPS